MAIKVALDGSKVRWEWRGDDGERIWGVKPSVTLRSRLLKKHTKRGEPDNIAFLVDLMAHCIEGWEGFKTPDGEDIEYKPELRKPFAEALLEQASDIFTACSELMTSAQRDEDEEEEADPLT